MERLPRLRSTLANFHLANLCLAKPYGPSLRAITCRQSRPPELAVSCHERNIPGKVAQSASEMAAILPPFLPHQPIFCLILIKYDAEKFV
jgi:hypothetical protein